jgi:hypothetical protein
MAKKLSRAEKMRRYMASNPEQTVAQVAAEFGVRYQIAYATKRSMIKVGSDTPISIDAVTGTTNKAMEELISRATQGRVRNAFSEETPTGIDATLAERGTKYGKFRDTAAVIYKLKNVLRNHASEQNKSFAFDQAEALDMICHKLGRIVNGDPDYADSWVDIAGYAKLVADRLTTGKQV